MDIASVLQNFSYAGTIDEISVLGRGHIHDTYWLKNKLANYPDYVLQKINHHVFRDVPGLMKNIDVVTHHIFQKNKKVHVADPKTASISLIRTGKNKLFYRDDQGGFWRMMNYIKDHRVYEKAPNPEIAYEGAKMFGRFIGNLSDLDPGNLVETIPYFHNVKTRFRHFSEALKNDPKDRNRYARQEIKYLQSQFEKMALIQNLKEKGELPVRVTHNDTKINNVLFDMQNRGICVIDLDTTMPGLVHFDFGDGIRTSSNTGKEDEEDLKNVSLDLKMFQAFSSGFVESLHHLLNETEKKTLVHAVALFPYLMGLRFLTDYINGDIYYKTEHPDHNLARAKAQLKLASDAQIKQAEMEQILKRILATSSN